MEDDFYLREGLLSTGDDDRGSRRAISIVVFQFISQAHILDERSRAYLDPHVANDSSIGFESRMNSELDLSFGHAVGERDQVCEQHFDFVVPHPCRFRELEFM